MKRDSVPGRWPVEWEVRDRLVRAEKWEKSESGEEGEGRVWRTRVVRVCLWGRRIRRRLSRVKDRLDSGWRL